MLVVTGLARAHIIGNRPIGLRHETHWVLCKNVECLSASVIMLICLEFDRESCNKFLTSREVGTDCQNVDDCRLRRWDIGERTRRWCYERGRREVTKRHRRI